jgi:hypothetical protein
VNRKSLLAPHFCWAPKIALKQKLMCLYMAITKCNMDPVVFLSTGPYVACISPGHSPATWFVYLLGHHSPTPPQTGW